jgi:hypothetical protein
MDMVGWYFGAAVLLIPAWLVLRAWHRYSKLDKRSLRDLPQMRTGIAFLSFSAGMWLALFVLIFAVDRGRPDGLNKTFRQSRSH